MGPAEEEEYVAYVSARAAGLRRIAYLLCGDWHRAEDIVQTAVTRLYVYWRKARAADHLDAYVRRIVVRTYLEEQRRPWARLRRTAEVPDRAAPEDSPDLRVTLVGALAKLPPRQRAVLVLRYLADQGVEETAAALGCSTGTVKSQTSRGLDTLRRLLPELREGALQASSTEEMR